MRNKNSNDLRMTMRDILDEHKFINSSDINFYKIRVLEANPAAFNKRNKFFNLNNQRLQDAIEIIMNYFESIQGSNSFERIIRESPFEYILIEREEYFQLLKYVIKNNGPKLLIFIMKQEMNLRYSPNYFKHFGAEEKKRNFLSTLEQILEKNEASSITEKDLEQHLSASEELLDTFNSVEHIYKRDDYLSSSRIGEDTLKIPEESELKISKKIVDKVMSSQHVSNDIKNTILLLAEGIDIDKYKNKIQTKRKNLTRDNKIKNNSYSLVTAIKTYLFYTSSKNNKIEGEEKNQMLNPFPLDEKYILKAYRQLTKFREDPRESTQEILTKAQFTDLLRNNFCKKLP